MSVSAAVDHSISQALTGPLHYITAEEDQDDEAGGGGAVGFKGGAGGGDGWGRGQLVKHRAHSKHVWPHA